MFLKSKRFQKNLMNDAFWSTKVQFGYTSEKLGGLF